MLSDKEILNLANGSDVRGFAIEGDNGEKVTFNCEAANRIATGFLKLLIKRNEGKLPDELKIAVGHDSRITSPELKDAVIDALLAFGVNVVDCGMATSPAMFMSIIFPEISADGAIMITASHLPFNRNGMKFFTRIGGVGHEDVATILKFACRSEMANRKIGKVEKYNLIERYSEHLIKKIKKSLGDAEKPLQGMKIVIDSGNGTSGFFATKVLQPLGADITGSQFLEPDGNFPNHEPNPEDEIAMSAIKKSVLENHANIGFLFDTDMDRVGAILDNGEEISRNSFIAMVAAILADEYPHSTIVTDSVTSDELTDFIEKKLGLHHLRYMRGYRNVINKCIELNLAGVQSPLAIETSGHAALRENYYLDDGAYLAVKFIIAATKLLREGKNLQSIIADLKHPAECAEYRLKISGVDNFRAYGNKVIEIFEMRAIERDIKISKPSFEGVRLNFAEGWVLFRLSLHNAEMPLNIESNSVGGMKKIIEVVRELLEDFDKLDTSVLEGK